MNSLIYFLVNVFSREFEALQLLKSYIEKMPMLVRQQQVRTTPTMPGLNKLRVPMLQTPMLRVVTQFGNQEYTYLRSRSIYSYVRWMREVAAIKCNAFDLKTAIETRYKVLKKSEFDKNFTFLKKLPID